MGMVFFRYTDRNGRMGRTLDARAYWCNSVALFVCNVVYSRCLKPYTRTVYINATHSLYIVWIHVWSIVWLCVYFSDVVSIIFSASAC